ncbi:TetR family transcriptional regulator [Nocardiopsis sp. HNM0947]|uniref:TetR family transcriptional regulator n=1 Tax=Nocardiopsis coralli TaxID=2772213 RepID=A0ABR9PBJ4_9ACTN|nr:TetR/AcrR family transcriptional regulator [Nocardiopsis coralli]MBE3001211.1 TetR family transcriptional regulator [Nocardiopsis coralli]
MSPRRRDEAGTAAARAHRRAQLLRTAAEVFAARGYSTTTVRQVADASGMLAGSLYYHFDSKESMVDEILSTFLTELWEDYDTILDQGKGARETLESLVTASFGAIDRHRPAVVIYQNESKHLAENDRFTYLVDSQKRFRQMWVGLLERGIEEGDFRADLDPPVIYRFIRDTVWVAAGWYRPDGRLTSEQVARQYLAMVLEGVQRR